MSADDVEKALVENPKIRAVVIVSPTYDGVVSDVKAISEVVHKKGIPLIVDEAHGAHFGLDVYKRQVLAYQYTWREGRYALEKRI